MEVFLFILSFISGGVILTVAYTTYLTNQTKAKQDKLVFLQEQLNELQKKQFEDFETGYDKQRRELEDIRSRMEGDQYRELSKTNQRITEDSLRLDLLIQDVNKMNIEQRGEINRIENDIQNRIVTVEKLVGNELKQNY